MRILIAGSSGLVGTATVAYLENQGHTVFKLIRDKEGKLPSDLSHYENMDAVINLCGDSIASGRWTENKKKKILESRVESTREICTHLKLLKSPPKVLINASAIGYYGDRGDEELTENSSLGSDFLSSVCKAWENETKILEESGIRVVILRFGAVLTAKGGALAKMVTPFKLGLGGNLGSGDQYFSFIALDDLTRVILFVIENEGMRGAVNAVTPNPVRNSELTRVLGSVLQRPTFFAVPEYVARVVFGQMADEVLLSSQRVVPQKLVTAGFSYNYPTIESTLHHCLT